MRPLGPFSAGSEPSSGTEGLRGDDGADHVDIHLAAEFIHRQLEHGPCDRNAGIVDEAGQRLAIEGLAHVSRGGEHRGLIGDVEQEWGEVSAELGFEPVRIGLFADAAEHAEAATDQDFCRGPANAGGRAGYDDRPHCGPLHISRSCRGQGTERNAAYSLRARYALSRICDGR